MEATFIKNLTSRGGAEQKLYRLSEPFAVKDNDDEVFQVDHVIVSGVVVVNRPETYVFPANEIGEIVDWLEQPGSFQGAVDHQRALDGFLELGPRPVGH